MDSRLVKLRGEFWAGGDVTAERQANHNSEQERRHSDLSDIATLAPRTPNARSRPSLLQSGGKQIAMHSDISALAELAPREVEADADREFAAPHRRVAARAATITETPTAAAQLRAPQRQVEEELAGLDLDHVLRDPSLKLASSGRASATVTHGHSRPGSQAYVGDDFYVPATGLGMVHTSRHGLGGSWPATPQLCEDLRQVAIMSQSHGSASIFAAFATATAETTDFQLWQLQVTEELELLRQLPSIASPESAAILERLATLATSGYQAAEAVTDRNSQVACLCASHALLRRVAVWTAAHRATTAVSSWAGDIDVNWGGRELVDRLIQDVAAEVAQTEDAHGWKHYLLLDELARANQYEGESQRRVIAQRFLSRLTWHGLTQPQRDWLERESVDALEAAVRRWAVAPVDYASLLGQLERQESDAIDLGAIDVARAVQSLRFATSPEAERLAATINTYYRNANIRLAVTDTLINRLVPEVDARIEPVRQQVLGADVRGQSHVDSQLAVRLVPSPSSWRLQLETTGRVRADMASRSGPVSIRTGSQAHFVSTTPIELTHLSASAGGTQVAVNSNTQIRGINTDYDSVPLIGSLVREIAASRYQSLAPKAKQIQHGQIRKGVGSEIDQRIGEQLNDAADSLTRHLVGPLGSLGLSPMVIDMQTSEQRLTARYRIGGDWQLAAFTPRPRAPADALMSLQIHQSALNNTLETVLPAGETKTIRQISDHLKELFAIQEGILASGDDDGETFDDTMIHFASTRPITVELEDDLLWITLRVMRLSREGAVDLRRFIVRAAYRCETDGLSAHLVREGHLRISGPGMSMRDRLPVRAIFNKVFSVNRPLPLVPARLSEHPAMAGLVITQLELRDGWIGLAIGPEMGTGAQPRVAKKD
jgi:hypothetical protein